MKDFFTYLEVVGSVGILGICCYKIIDITWFTIYKNVFLQLFDIIVCAAIVLGYGFPWLEKSLKKATKNV